MSLCFNTGIQIDEFCNLKLDDIYWNKNELIVTGKGQKTRIIPIKDYVLHWITSYIIRD
ncbi:MAG: tyrosine-type recombinase/integrase [Candidatus Thermoplasmatota archaeon]|nr:tyrosine-type recombinase/integrase [Candidatus Thermoplasmatota archaeon]